MSLTVRRRPRPAPTPLDVLSVSQDELRDMRRRGLIHDYAGCPWSLVAEVQAITEPLAARIAAPAPGGPRYYLADVRELADAVHAVVSLVVRVLAEDDAYRRTEHVPYDQRGRSIRLLTDMVERPAAPELDMDTLRDGTWPDVLTELCQPYDAGFAELLARTAPTGAYLSNGKLSVSERLRRELVTVDVAARELNRRLDIMAEHHRRYPDGSASAGSGPQTAESKRAAARAELAALGVDMSDLT